MKLSNHFTLDEFLVSQTAERHDIDMTPPRFVIDNLKVLCTTVLEPLRIVINTPIIISSGYRPEALNHRIGGSKKSAHIAGRAADMRAIGMTPLALAQEIEELDLVVDQVIHEFGRWVHVGISVDPRYEMLTAYKSNGHTRYVTGLQEISA